MLIDSGSTHNLMWSEFASKLGQPHTKIEHCKVFLSNGELSPIECWLLKVHVMLQGTHTIEKFQGWTWIQDYVILGMLWLNVVNAWIACNHKDPHVRLSNGKPFKIKCKRTQPKVFFYFLRQREKKKLKKETRNLCNSYL